MADEFQSKPTVTDRLRAYISRENEELAGLTKEEKVKKLFPRLPRRRKSSLSQTLSKNAEMYAEAASAGLATTPTEFWTKVRASGLSAEEWIKRSRPAGTLISEPVRHIFEKGGATPQEMMAKRIEPKRMGEILSTYFKTEGVDVVSGEKKLAEVISRGGASSEEALKIAREYVGARPEDRLAWTAAAGSSPTGSPLVYLRSKEDLLAQGIESPNRLKMLMAGHEAVETRLLKKEGTPWLGRLLSSTKPRVGHVSPEIYSSEFELASMTSPEALRDIIQRRSKEIPRVVSALEGLPDSADKRRALEALKKLPSQTGKILEAHGYSAGDVGSYVSAIRRAVSSGSTHAPLPASPKTAPTYRAPTPSPIGGKYAGYIPIEQAELPPSVAKRIAGLPQIEGPGLVTKISKGTGTAGKSNWSKWLREGMLPQGSARFVLRTASDELQSRIAGGQKAKPQWLAFLYDAGQEDTFIDLTQEEGRRRLTELELEVAKAVDDGDAAEKLARRVAQYRQAQPKKQVSRKGHGPGVPTSRTGKTAARKTVEEAVAKEAQGVAEFKLLPVLEDYVSQGIKDAERANQMGPLRRVAPYAVGALVGADVLASRDKTGPFWGGVVAGAAWLLTRGKVSRNTRLLAAAGGYGAGRLAGGALSASHSGQIEGFEEQFGFNPAMRDAHSDFGSGWHGIGKRTLRVLRGFLIPGMGEAGESSIGRKQLTDFGSAWNRASQVIKTAAEKLLRLGGLQERGVIQREIVDVSKELSAAKLRKTFDVSGGLRSAKTIATGAGKQRVRGKPKQDLPKRGLSGLGNIDPEARAMMEAILAQQGEAVPRRAAGATASFRKPVDPLGATQGRVEAASAKTIVTSGSQLSPTQVDKAIAKFKRGYSDYAHSLPHGSRRRQHKPRVLESFNPEVGVAGATRKDTTLDFGHTGWDPLRRIGASLLGKASKEGAEVALRGAKYKEFLRSNELQEALAKGTVIKKLGAGGVGSVELMETTIGTGRSATKFRYARKMAEDVGEFSAEQILEGETRGLRALQGSIAPTPYGKGKVALEGREVPVMYFEAIEDAVTADVAIAQQGGFTRKQVNDLWTGIETLHKKGLVHSDIKPANILIDKQGRLSLIDPFPDRYKVSGWGAFADDEALNRLSRAQDQVAVERIAVGGNVENLTYESNVISNALPYSTMPEERVRRELGHGGWDELSPWAREIYKRSKNENLHKRFQQEFGASVFSNKSKPSVERTPIPTETQAARRRQIARIDAQMLHQKAVKQSAQNQSRGAKGHQNMDQGDFLAKLQEMNDFDNFR